MDASLTGVALKILAIRTSGRLVIRNLSGAGYWAVAIEIARKRIVCSTALVALHRMCQLRTVHSLPIGLLGIVKEAHTAFVSPLTKRDI